LDINGNINSNSSIYSTSQYATTINGNLIGTGTSAIAFINSNNISGNITGSVLGNITTINGNLNGLGTSTIAILNTNNISGNITGSVLGNITTVNANIHSSVSGNITTIRGNLNGEGISAIAFINSRNISGNIHSSVSGNITTIRGNLNGAGISAIAFINSNNISGNIHSSVSGNITTIRGNLNGAGISAIAFINSNNISGNITGSVLGNITTVNANIHSSVSGNITTIRGNLNGPGISSITTLNATTINGNITSPGNSIFNSSVGIGTSSPAQILDISAPQPNLIIRASGQATDNKVWGYGPNGTVLYFGAVSDDTLTWTNWMQVSRTGMTVNNICFPSTGNVGINTTSPTATLQVNGSLSKTSGTFEIEHPIVPNKILIHSFIEGPRCDNIYRGTTVLTAGNATIILDRECVQYPESEMSIGTFVALNRNVTFFLQNNSSFERVIGNYSNGILTITSENPNSTDTIYWFVMGERQDNFIKKWDKTNATGNLITEHHISTLDET
jgi:hypothetical protein